MTMFFETSSILWKLYCNIPPLKVVSSCSRSALFIKTKNNVRACPLLKHPCIHLFLLESSNILTNLIASKYITIHTQGSKNKYINSIYHVYKCLEMQNNGPITCIISNHGFSLIKLLLIGWKNVWFLVQREIKKKKKNFGLQRRPTWIKCMFDPPPIQCPHDKGMEVQIYSSLSRVDTIITSHQ